MKQLFSGVMALLMILTLTACGGKAETYDAQCASGTQYLADGNCEEAILAFTAAIETKPKRTEAYSGLADTYIKMEEFDKAMEALQQGVDATGDEKLSVRLKEMKKTEDEKAEALAVQKALGDIPYYGDVSKCKLSVKQANGYAQFLADGIAGLIPVYGSDTVLSLVDEEQMERTILWDQPFVIQGYDAFYETSRSYAVLCDLDGGGSPYLLLTNGSIWGERNGGNSYSVFGWQDGAVTRLVEYEDVARDYIDLDEDTETGIVTLDRSGSGGAADHGGSSYVFEHGTVRETESWHEYLDYETELMHVIENDVETVYTLDEFSALQEAPSEPEPEREIIPHDGPGLPEVVAQSCSLREMVAGLNNYCALRSSGNAPTVDCPPHTDRQQMAVAMENKLDCVVTGDYGEDTLINWGYTRLIDLNGDGVEELVACGVEHPTCKVYKWQNGNLTELDFGWGAPANTGDYTLVDEITLVQAKDTGEYGILTIGYTDMTFYLYGFLTHHEGVSMVDSDWDGERIMQEEAYWHGEEPCTEAEYNRVNNAYKRVEPISSYSQEVVPHLDETRAALQKMMRGK
ncbi:MAG: tetratricopeptide repeat protein [Evtepia sp.]